MVEMVLMDTGCFRITASEPDARTAAAVHNHFAFFIKHPLLCVVILPLKFARLCKIPAYIRKKVLQKIKIYVTFTPYLKNIPLSIDNTTLLTLWDFLCPAIIRLLKNLVPTPAHTDVYADKPYIQALTAT